MAKGKKRVRPGRGQPAPKAPDYQRPKPPKVRATETLEASAWEKLSPRTRHAVCLLLLALVGLGFFAPVTFGGKTLVGSDTVQWRGMAQAMLEYEQATGGDLALWAPNLFGGMPGYMIHYPLAVPQLDSALSWLRGLGLWPLAHFLALLLGAYLAGYYLLRDHLAATLGAVAYGLTTYVSLILIAGHNSKFIAMALAPWLVLSYAYAVRRPPGASWLRALLGGLLFAVALGANLRAGHVQFTYYVAFALLVAWIVEGVQAAREGQLRDFGVSTAALAVGGVLAVLMVAQPYLVYAEYKAFTIRSAGEGGGLAFDYAMGWSQGIGELVTLLIPDAYGGGGQTYWGPKPFTAGPHYLGPIVLMLAGLALYGVKRRIVWGLGIAAGLMVLFSLGEHFGLLNRLMFDVFPLFDAFRVPETWLAAVALAAAVLACAGVYYVARPEAVAEAEERKTRAVHVALGATLGLLVLLLVTHGLFFSFERAGEAEQVAAAYAQQAEQAGIAPNDPRVATAITQTLGELEDERKGMFVGDAMRAVVFVLLAGALLVLGRRRKIPGWALQAGLLLLVTIDLWQVGRRYFSAESPSLRTTGEAAATIPQYGFDQFIAARIEVAGGPGHFRTLSLEQNPWVNARPSFYYESIGGNHGAKLALYQDYIEEILPNEDGSLNENALDLTSTRYVVARGLVPGLEPVHEDPQAGVVVLENPDALPRAFFAERVEVIADRDRAIARLRDPGFDPATAAILHAEPPVPLPEAPVDSASTASARLIRFTPREIVYEVETDRPRLLVFSEVYYPAGWTARIGAEPVEILRADHLLRAVVVPEGRHLVSMRFEPETHARSVLIATLATALAYIGALLVAGLVWYRRGEHG